MIVSSPEQHKRNIRREESVGEAEEDWKRKNPTIGGERGDLMVFLVNSQIQSVI